MQRTFDPELLNRVANHPDVRPWLGAGGALDLGPVLANHAHYALVGEDGGFVFLDKGGGAFEVHTQFLPDCRDDVRALALDAVAYMFTNTMCDRITTMVPDDNARAMRLALHAGFEPSHIENNAWPTADGLVALTHLRLDRWRWENSRMEAA